MKSEVSSPYYVSIEGQTGYEVKPEIEPFQSGEVTGGGGVQDAKDLLTDPLVGEHPRVDLLLVQGHQVVKAMEVEDLGELVDSEE